MLAPVYVLFSPPATVKWVRGRDGRGVRNFVVAAPLEAHGTNPLFGRFVQQYVRLHAQIDNQ